MSKAILSLEKFKAGQNISWAASSQRMNIFAILFLRG